MTQFNVHRIGPEIKVGTFDISFTNASLFMIISSVAILLIFSLGSKKNSLLPNKIQLLAELSYTFVSKMISDTAGSKAKPYFSFIFSLFMFVLLDLIKVSFFYLFSRFLFIRIIYLLGNAPTINIIVITFFNLWEFICDCIRS